MENHIEMNDLGVTPFMDPPHSYFTESFSEKIWAEISDLGTKKCRMSLVMYHSYDGRNPNHQLKTVVNIPLFIGFQPSFRWFIGFLPSLVCKLTMAPRFDGSSIHGPMRSMRSKPPGVRLVGHQLDH